MVAYTKPQHRKDNDVDVIYDYVYCIDRIDYIYYIDNGK